MMLFKQQSRDLLISHHGGGILWNVPLA